MKTLECLLEGVDLPAFRGDACGKSQVELNGILYTLLEQRGEGGQGAVYHAQDVDENDVALKMLHQKPSPEQIRSFGIYEKLHGVDCIPTLLDHSTTDGGVFGRYVLVTDYIDGVTLSQLLSKKRFNTEEVREFLEAALYGLQELHSYNVLHRDIKPSNIMIDRNGHLKYIDMGLVRSVHRETFSGTMGVGTGQYAAPEQLYGEPVPASDIYSLGVVAWQMLTGNEPPELYHPLADTRALKFDDLRATVPADFLSVVEKMCEKDVNKRYQNVAEALQNLEGRVSETAAILQQDKEQARGIALRNELYGLCLQSVGSVAGLVGVFSTDMVFSLYEGFIFSLAGSFFFTGFATMLLGGSQLSACCITPERKDRQEPNGKMTAQCPEQIPPTIHSLEKNYLFMATKGKYTKKYG